LKGKGPDVTGGKWGGTDETDQQELRGDGQEAGKPAA